MKYENITMDLTCWLKLLNLTWALYWTGIKIWIQH